MQPINRPVTNPHLSSNLDNQKNDPVGNGITVSTLNSDTINLGRRIEENRPLLDDLKNGRHFQNVLTIMRKIAVPKELLLKFLIGKVHFEELLVGSNSNWPLALVRSIYRHGLTVQPIVYYHEGDPMSYEEYFLDRTLADRLSAIFRHGFWESREKTYAKLKILIEAITNENSSGKLDLSNLDLDLSKLSLNCADFSNADCRGTKFGNERAYCARINLAGADCRGADFGAVRLDPINLTGANLLGAKAKDPIISGMIKEQELFERYKLLPQTMEQHGFNFPRELINNIGLDLRAIQ
jgi:hypothetical protein